MELIDYIHELTNDHVETEHYTVRVGAEWRGRDHTTHVPGLIQQLWENDTPSAATDQGGGARPGFTSKPAARLEALDAAVRIDLAAARWIRDLTGAGDEPLDTADCVRRLGALAASAHRCHRTKPVRDQDTRRVTCCTWHAIDADVRRWWTQARIVTGWDSPAWTPDNTCPQCGERGTLRVRLAEHIAMCTNDACRVTWDEATIGLLADHIRSESAEDRRSRSGVGPCWCPWPAPTVPDLAVLCSRCGSARCRHAVGRRLVEQLSGRLGA